MTPRQRSYDEVDDKVREDIRTHGWSDMSIFPVKEDGTVAFNYSVGFTVRDHPEVMVMGLDYVASWADEADGVALAATWAGTGAYAAVELEG